MKKLNLIFILSIACILITNCKGLHQIKTSGIQSKNLDIYLLIGQSNMAGRAPIEDQDKDTLKNVFLYTGIEGNIWEKAANPLNKYSTVRKNINMQKLNPGYTFAREMALKSKNDIGLVVNAKGGTNINLWDADSLLYKEAVSRTREALKYGTLKGILWHQGEANVGKYKQYMPKIVELINSLRNDFNQPYLPFIAGQLSEGKEARKNFNKMILTLPQEIEHVAVVSSENTSTIDKTHFDSASQRLLGKRYAAEMQKLLTTTEGK